MPQSVVEFHSVSKTYPVYGSAADRLKELAGLHRFASRRLFTALSNVSFEVAPGETICIVGENGAGKSTLLQIVAGILQPSAGQAIVRGRVSALLELGAGFNPDYTGRENVFLNAAIHGFSGREMERRFQDIADFAELGDFMERPVRTWSSGMVVRLAFAVAIHVEPEILLVDEALSVGDAYFRQRCLRRVNEMRRAGVTILFVSHSMADVEALGDRAIWLEHGRIREIGAPGDVVLRYIGATERSNAAVHTDASGDRLLNIDHRCGDARAAITGMSVVDDAGRHLPLLLPSQRMTVRIAAIARERIARPVVGFLIRNHLGIDFAGTDTQRENVALGPLEPGAPLTVEFRMQTPELCPTSFSFSPFIHDGDRVCDHVDNAITLEVTRGEREVYGQIHLPCRIELDRTLPEWQPRRAHAVESSVA
ncbi:MAG TPA: ABC transporter ATP-binding protein [Bryobacteraceae bacterium]|nr:ABC transporter ATP-binding protein [Bryobacteraceae bacterium]